MEGESSWISHCLDDMSREIDELDSSYSSDKDEQEESEESNSATHIAALPDDLLERILASLPTASVVRCGCVCKRWRGIVASDTLWRPPRHHRHKPWYFMFTGTGDVAGHAYDPALKKWYPLDLPRDRLFATSSGLVCSIDAHHSSRPALSVCNPLTAAWRRLPDPPSLSSDYTALALSKPESESKPGYTVSIVRSKQFRETFHQWDVSIHVFESSTGRWANPLAEVLAGWRGGDESVICRGSLYFLIYSTGAGPAPAGRHGLVRRDLGGGSGAESLMGSFVAVPCSLTCGRLMNLRGRVVMVGGIGKADRPDIIKGIGIWGLSGTGKEWEEIARMPHKFFHGFGEFDDVFASSGTGDVVYIQSYGAPALLMYDLALRQWKWSQKCPVSKRFPLQLFTGFCFEPRLEIAP